MSEDSGKKGSQNSFKNLIKRSGRQISEKLKITSATKDDDDYVKEMQTYSELMKFQKKFKVLCNSIVTREVDKSLIELFSKYRTILSNIPLSNCFADLKDEFVNVYNIKKELVNNINTSVLADLKALENEDQLNLSQQLKNTNNIRLDYDNIKNSKKPKELIVELENQLMTSRTETFCSLTKYNYNTTTYLSHIYDFIRAIQKYHENTGVVYSHILTILELELETLEKEVKSNTSNQDQQILKCVVRLDNENNESAYNSEPLRTTLDNSSCDFTTEFSSILKKDPRKLVVTKTYVSDQLNHLSAYFGEHIYFLQIKKDNWYLVKNKYGKIGIIPSNNVEFMD